MKKYLFSILALAGFVACSTDSELNESIAPEQKELFTLNASIATPDESRVLIEGERFTEVSWESGDFISIRSASGVGESGRAVLEAESAGSTDVKFTGDLAFTQNADTYYAVYPERTFDSATISVDYTTQDGSAQKAALLVGTAVDAYKYDVNMTFKPVNALIHVTLTGAPATASKVVLQRMGNEKEITPIYSYNVENGGGVLSGSSSAITVNNPSSNSFFIALPAYLSLDNYELIFTVGDKTFAKGFAGKTFAMGTTTNVNVAWELPSVTLGAKTSYSYYANGNATMANKCDNSTIYFNQGPDGDKCYSSYSGIQDAMVTDCGFIVGETTYNTSNGVTWDKSTNQFYMDNLGSQAWQAHTVQAFIVTKHNGTITSSADLHVTGLPYTPSNSYYNIKNSGDHAWIDIEPTWQTSNSWSGTSVELEGASAEPKVTTPYFHIPGKTNIVATATIERIGSLKKTFIMSTYSDSRVVDLYNQSIKNGTYSIGGNAEFDSSVNRIFFQNCYGAAALYKTTISNVSITYRQ